MPRIARLKLKGEPAVYHVVSRTALDGFVLGNVETPVKSASLVFREEFNRVKGYMHALVEKFSSLYFAEVLGFCFTPLNSLRKHVLHLCPAE